MAYTLWHLAVEIVGQSEDEQALTCNIPDTEDTVAYENQDVEAVAMVEGSPTDAQLDFHQRGIFLILFYCILFAFVGHLHANCIHCHVKILSVCMIGYLLV